MSDSSIPRRSFMSRLASGAAALGITSVFAGTASASSPDGELPAPDALDVWLAAMKAPYKCIYDCVHGGGASDGILYARNLITLSGEKLGTKDKDMNVIVSFRHFATPFAFNDAMWAKYPQLAEVAKVDDPATKQRATRNVLLHDEVFGFSGANIPGLRARGVQYTACGAATTFISGVIAGKTGDAKAVEAELAANLVPSARIVPAGVVVVQRAQKAGFAYTYAG